MDPLTHSLAGILVSKAFPKRKAALATALFAANAPDLDYVTYLFGTDVFIRYHRGITHGIGGLVLFSLIMGMAMYVFSRRGFLFYLLLSLAGYGSHIVLDLLNRYPLRLLSPFDWSKYSLDVLVVVDPYITAVLLAGVVLTMKKDGARRVVTAVTLAFMALYVTGRFYLKGLAEDFLRSRTDEYVYRLYPLPNDFLRWWFVMGSKNVYKVGTVDLFTRRICTSERFVYSEQDPEVEESKELRSVRNFLYFATFPLPEVERRAGETIVTWRELSYTFLPGKHFIAEVTFDRMGRAVEERVKF